MFTSHKKVTFISKHDVLPVICSPAFVFLLPIHFVFMSVNSCFLTGLMYFLHPMIRRFLTSLALISVPVRATSLCRSKLFFLGSNLLCLITKISSLELVLRFLPHLRFHCDVADPVLATCFISRDTVNCLTSKRLAIFLCESPAWFHKLRMDAHFFGVVSDIVAEENTKLPCLSPIHLLC